MGIYDRDYNRHQPQYRTRYSMSPMTPAVKWLLIINIAAYLISNLFPVLYVIFAIIPENTLWALQAWRYVTYQFLHDRITSSPGIFHLLFNMIGLFFLGPLFERQWGTRYFLKFYFICGTVGGVLFSILVLTHVLAPGLLVGASGSIFGLFAAAFIFYPRMQVYVYGIFPIQMRILIPVMIGISVMGFISGSNSGGEAAHLAGLATGFVLLKYRGWFSGLRFKTSKGAWEKKMKKQRDFQNEVNRILDKVNSEGINSLTRAEKTTLKKATEMEQNRR